MEPDGLGWSRRWGVISRFHFGVRVGSVDTRASRLGTNIIKGKNRQHSILTTKVLFFWCVFGLSFQPPIPSLPSAFSIATVTPNVM